MFAIVVAVFVCFAAAAEMPVEEKSALREAKQNYKIQMQFQGHYPKEAAKLKLEYLRKAAAIESEYAGPANASANPVLLVSVGDTEEDELHQAKQDYHTQMQYQGHYPKEAAELKQEYDRRVAAINSKYVTPERNATHAAAAPLLLASMGVTPVEEQKALREAKQNYKTQMQYQGHYPKEATELKQEYDRKVATIKKKYAAVAVGSVLAGTAAMFAANIRARTAAPLHQPFLLA